jgi:cytochrome c oxidase accessory protein FixG
MCVQACPTGIDIRNGLQYQCIGCAACIDICNEVMDKVGYERGLIRYTTENALEGKATHVLRPRMVVYALLLCIITGGLFYSMATRVPLELDIIRDRNALYRETDEGWIENIYTLKIINMDEQSHRLSLSAGGIPGLRLLGVDTKFTADSGHVMEKVVRLQVDPEVLQKTGYDISFRLQAVDQPSLTVNETGRFIGPVRR